MEKNRILKPTTPSNPSPVSVIQKEKYTLFAPVAGNGQRGMAKFNTKDFKIDADGEVSMSDNFINAYNDKLNGVDSKITEKLNGVDTAITEKFNGVDTTINTKLSNVDTAINTKIGEAKEAIDDVNDSIFVEINTELVSDTQDNEYNLIFTRSDGSTETVSFIAPKGATGATGATGAKLISQVLQYTNENGDNVYLQTFDDGTEAFLIAPKGEQGIQGIQGIQGVGIETAELISEGAQEYYFKITLSNGQQVVTRSFTAPKGDEGERGYSIYPYSTSISTTPTQNTVYNYTPSYIKLPDGVYSSSIKKGSLLLDTRGNVYLITSIEDEKCKYTGISIKGDKGEQGATGETGIPGTNAKNIVDIYVNKQYESEGEIVYALVVYLEDGTSVSTEFAIPKPQGGSGGSGKTFASIMSVSMYWDSVYGNHPVYLLPRGFNNYKITAPEYGTVSLSKEQLENGSGRYPFSDDNMIEQLSVLGNSPYYDPASLANDYYAVGVWHSYMDGEYYNSIGTLLLVAE